MMEQQTLPTSGSRCTRQVPSPVSVKDLMNMYDTLVAQLNELHSDGKDNDPQTSSPTHADKARYDTLILVCRLLVWTPLSRAENNHTMTATIPWTKPQLETLQSTIRAACAWRHQRASPLQGNCNCNGQTSHCGECDAALDDSPQISHVRIYQDPMHQVAILEWTASSPTVASGTGAPTIALASDMATDNVDNGDENGVLWVASLDRQELAAEEDELWRMAQTPIPSTPP
jgi:hypothetical protein